MATDPLIDSIKRLLTAPRIKYDKGLLKKANTDINGFVKDLNNFKIDRFGVAERRLGSRCMVTPVDDVNQDWLLYFSEEISGSEIAFLVNGEGKLYCFNDMYPEVLFRINKTGFSQFYYEDADAFSYELTFERGNVFDKVIRDDSVSIYNEYGDMFTFNKFGAISFSYTSNHQDMYLVKGRLDGLRTVTASLMADLSPCVYLDVTFTRMKPIDTFNTVPAQKTMYDINGETNDDGVTIRGSQRPRIHSLRGDLRVAQVDSMGRIGRMSQSVILKDYAEKYISLINTYSVPGVISNYLGTIDVTDVEEFGKLRDRSDFQFLYATRNQPSYTAGNAGSGAYNATFKVECPDQEWSFSETQPNLTFANVAMKKFRLGFLPDIITTPYGEFVRATMWCDYDFSELDSDRQIVPENIGEVLKGYGLQFLKPPVIKATGVEINDIIVDDDFTTGTEGEFISDGDADLTGTYSDTFPDVPLSDVNIYIRHAAYAEEYPTKYDTTGPVSLDSGFVEYTLKEGDSEQLESGMIYDVLIGIPSGDAKLSERFFNMTKNDGLAIALASGEIGDDKIATQGFTGLGVITINMETSEGGTPIGFVPACHVYQVPTRTRAFVLLKNIGYNNWIAKRNVAIPTLILDHQENYSVSINGDLQAKTDLTTSEISDLISGYDVACIQNEYDDFMKSGSRFAVWNDGNVVAISQKCFMSSVSTEDNYLIPIYEKTDDSTSKAYESGSTGRVVNYQTEIDAVGYLPICSIEFINVGSFAYPLNTLQKSVEFLKKMVVNNGVVFVIDAGGLWIGSERGYLTLDVKVTLDKSVVDIAKFDSGVIVFCRDAVYVVDSKGNISDVKNLDDFDSVNAITVKTVDNGETYGVMSSGEAFRARINYTEQNAKYYALENLSIPVPDIKWDSETDIAFSNNTTWFSSGSKIYGLSYGGWKEVIDLGTNHVSGIFSYRNRLCVILNNNTFFMGKFKTVGLPVLIGG